MSILASVKNVMYLLHVMQACSSLGKVRGYLREQEAAMGGLHQRQASGMCRLLGEVRVVRQECLGKYERQREFRLETDLQEIDIRATRSPGR